MLNKHSEMRVFRMLMRFQPKIQIYFRQKKISHSATPRITVFSKHNTDRHAGILVIDIHRNECVMYVFDCLAYFLIMTT